MLDNRRTETLAVLGIGTALGVTAGVATLQVVGPPGAPALSRLIFVSNTSYWVLWSVVALGALWLGRRVPFTDGRPIRAFFVHAAASLLFAFVHLKLWTLAVVLWRGTMMGEPLALGMWLTDRRWLLRWQVEWELTMYWALIGLAHALTFRAESRARALAAARLDADLSQAKLQALQRQMHPHFLFNTLQSISILMHHRVDAAEQMIERLGALLRASLRRDDNHLVPLSRELEYAAHYLAIEQMNMGDRLRVETDVAADTLACAVPELLVQPLVENAVRHGIAPMARGGTLRIVARRERDMLVLRVIDDGAGIGKTPEGMGIALENTRRRLEMLYPDRHAFEIGEGPGGRGVVVEVLLPFASAADSTPFGRRPAETPERTVTGAPGVTGRG